MVVNTSVNFRTRSALQHALMTGQEVRIFSPTLNGVHVGQPKRFGMVLVTGPWSPAGSTWEAEVFLHAGKVVSIRP